MPTEVGAVPPASAPAVGARRTPAVDDSERPRGAADGKQVSNAKMTVRHNGVLIHENAEIPKVTPGGTQAGSAATGPLHLQNHGNPVRYRNIWVLPKRS